MWRKKEYGRMFSGLKTVRNRQRITVRTKMSEACTKMETDEKEGRGYASGRHVREGNMEGEEPASRKRARAGNNQLTGCKCGAVDHQRVTLKHCAWRGLSKKEIFEKYEKRMKHENAEKSAAR
jgi:hypothetical protein